MKPSDPNSTVWPGHCFDILYLSTMSMSDIEPYPLPAGTTPTGCKAFNAFDLTPDNEEQFTTKNARMRTDYQSDHNVICSSWDYSKRTEKSIKVSVGVKPSKKASFAASLSTEWTELQQSSLALESVTTLTSAVRRSYELDLDNELGDRSGKAVLPIDPDYALDLWNAATGDSAAQASFIQKYGTHFANQVTLGGIGRQQFTLDVSDYASLSESGVKVAFDATMALKAVEVGTAVSASTNVSDAFKQKIQGQQTALTYVGGTSAGPSFDDWLNSVDEAPVPVEVSLLQHDALIRSAYFPNASAQQLSDAANAMGEAIGNYIESNGIDMSASVIREQDMVLLVPFPPTPGGNGALPAMLYQPASLLQPQSAVGVPPNVNSQQFLAALRNNFANYVWQVTLQAAPSGDASDVSVDITRVNITNMGTNAPLDSEGGYPNQGGVSANTGIAPLGTAPNSTREWSFELRTGNTDPNRPLTTGDVIALRRAYPGIAGQPNDPRGLLCTRGDLDLAFSNGEIYSGGPIASGMAFMVVKVTAAWDESVTAPPAMDARSAELVH